MIERRHPPEARAPRGHASITAYLVIAAILTIITLMEVGVFYIPEFAGVLVPVLLILSAVKFALVVMFYMHLKFDRSLFSGIFLLPLTIALVLAVSLLFLTDKFRL